MRSTWTADMVNALLGERAGGETDFDRAWRHAAKRNPRPRDYTGDLDGIPLSTFFREACRNEWYGLVHADYIGLREMIELEPPAPARHRLLA